MAQAVHQRPGRRSGAADIAPIRGKRGLELIEGAGRRGAQPRVFLQRDLTAEHEPKALRILQREAHVCLAHAAAGLAAHGLAQHFEALRGKRREQRLAVGKMTVGRVVGDPDPARRLAQA